jgi:hypothetical protein
MSTTTHIAQQPPRTQHLFVVRLWQETDAVTASVQWRGSVKHVLTEQNYYFTHLPDLLTFITTMTIPTEAAAAAIVGKHSETVGQ